jgi:hypothetical protein
LYYYIIIIFIYPIIPSIAFVKLTSKEDILCHLGSNTSLALYFNNQRDSIGIPGLGYSSCGANNKGQATGDDKTKQ